MRTKKETFIANGRKFKSFEAVEQYARDIGMRISSTEKIRPGIHLIGLKS